VDGLETIGGPVKEAPSTVQALLDQDIVQNIVEETGRRLEARLAAPPLQPRGLTLQRAAQHCGVTSRGFKELVQTGLMPPPCFRQGGRPSGRPIWDRLALDAAFDRLSGLREEKSESTTPNDWLQCLERQRG